MPVDLFERLSKTLINLGYSTPEGGMECFGARIESQLYNLCRGVDSILAQQVATPYDQQALELCPECGWKAIMPGEPCLVCNMQIEAQQVAVPATDAEKMDLVTNWFSDEWAVKSALGLLADYEQHHGIGAKP